MNEEVIVNRTIITIIHFHSKLIVSFYISDESRRDDWEKCVSHQVESLTLIASMESFPCVRLSRDMLNVHENYRIIRRNRAQRRIEKWKICLCRWFHNKCRLSTSTKNRHIKILLHWTLKFKLLSNFFIWWNPFFSFLTLWPILTDIINSRDKQSEKEKTRKITFRERHRIHGIKLSV